MNQDLSEELIRLVEFDQETRTFLHKKEICISEVSRLTAERDELMLSIQTFQSEMHNAKKEVDNFELAIKELEDKEREKRKRLDSVANQREYYSLRAELDTLLNERAHIESALVDAWNRLENGEKKFIELQRNVVAREKELETAISDARTCMSDVEHELEQRSLKRAVLLGGIQPEWLDSYESMRLHVPNPLVPLAEGGCSACFYPVSNQDRRSLQAGKLLQCKGCYRFLYVLPTV